MTKQWKVYEIALACKAYISATKNPINGTDKYFHTFSLDLVDRLNHISPSDCVDSTYYKWGARVYPYLRDNVFPDVQKFHKAMRVVLISNPTDVTDKEKVNMSVAIQS